MPKPAEEDNTKPTRSRVLFRNAYKISIYHIMIFLFGQDNLHCLRVCPRSVLPLVITKEKHAVRI